MRVEAKWQGDSLFADRKLKETKRNIVKQVFNTYTSGLKKVRK
jgi:hypothetical protein